MSSTTTSVGTSQPHPVLHGIVTKSSSASLLQVVSTIAALMATLMSVEKLTLQYHFGMTRKSVQLFRPFAATVKPHEFTHQFYNLLGYGSTELDTWWLKKKTWISSLQEQMVEYSLKFNAERNGDVLIYQETKHLPLIIKLLGDKMEVKPIYDASTIEEAFPFLEILSTFTVQRYHFHSIDDCSLYLDSVQMKPGLHYYVGTIQMKKSITDTCSFVNQYPAIPKNLLDQVHIVAPVRSSIMAYLHQTQNQNLLLFENDKEVFHDTFRNRAMFSDQHEYISDSDLDSIAKFSRENRDLLKKKIAEEAAKDKHYFD